jgi:hypothetical protein
MSGTPGNEARTPIRPGSALAIAATAIALAGCGGRAVDESYGRIGTRSINGTGVFAGLLSARGHEVRAAVRLTQELRDWADVIVRFAPSAGPVEREEAQWYSEWLNESPRRRLVYVPRDYEATVEYWTMALDQLPKDAPSRLRERIEEARTAAENSGKGRFPIPVPAKKAGKPKAVAPSGELFSLKESTKGPSVCKELGGPWAKGVDAAKAALTKHQTIKLGGEELLLSGDGEPLVVTWRHQNTSAVLVVANGSFLLNVPLVNRARWPLAERTVAWAAGASEEDGEEAPMEPKRIAFVEGGFVLSGPFGPPSVFEIARKPPFDWPVAQLLALGLAACLARAPRLGRARSESPSGADRPVAHPEALGALLARTSRASEARDLLESFRRWRNRPSPRGSRTI